MSNLQMAMVMLIVGFPSKNASMCAMFSGVTANGLPPIGADDAFFGVEALDEQFEGVLLRDCMMI